MANQAIESIIENFDLEVESRVRSLWQRYELSVMDLKSRLDLEVNRIPDQILLLPMSKFCYQFKGDFKLYFESMLKMDFGDKSHCKTDSERKEKSLITDGDISLESSVRRSARKRAPLNEVNFQPPLPKVARTGTARKAEKPETHERRTTRRGGEKPEIQHEILILDTLLDEKEKEAESARKGTRTRKPRATPSRNTTLGKAPVLHPFSKNSFSSFGIPETPTVSRSTLTKNGNGMEMSTPRVIKLHNLTETPFLMTPGFNPLSTPGFVPMTPGNGHVVPKVAILQTPQKVSNIITVPLKDGNIVEIDATGPPVAMDTMSDGERQELCSHLSSLNSQIASLLAIIGGQQ